MARLARLKEIMSRRPTSRGLKDEDAAKLIAEGLPVHWITRGLHSVEWGSPEMMMELAYRLAVEESDTIKAIRKSLVVLVTPILEVDGWDKAVACCLYSSHFFFERKGRCSGRAVRPFLFYGGISSPEEERNSY